MSPTTATSRTRSRGTLALLGGREWTEGCRALDEELLAASGATDVLVIPTAAAYERPARLVERATAWFAELGATVRPLPVLNRREAESDANVSAARAARFLYVSDGSPLHLRSVLKGSALWEAMVAAYRDGAVLAASGAGATVVCDPMVDPRGGAYTVGLGIVSNLAVFPYHGTTAAHLLERSIELLPAGAVLAGIDETTALVRAVSGEWRAAGDGAVTLYRRGGEGQPYRDEVVPTLTA